MLLRLGRTACHVWGALLLLLTCAMAAPNTSTPNQLVTAAVAQFEHGPAQAVAALARASHAHPLLKGPLDLLRAEALLASGARREARRLAEQLLGRDGRFDERARWTLVLATDDCHVALAHLAVLRADPPRLTESERLSAMSAAHQRCGSTIDADRIKRRLAIHFPTTSEGRLARAQIELGGSELLALAATLTRLRQDRAAQTILVGLIAGPFGAEARRQLATLHLEHLREDLGFAARTFEALSQTGPDQEGAAWSLARTLARGGDAVSSDAAFATYLTRWPEGAHADDAHFFRAFSAYESGRYVQAARAFEVISAGTWRDAARWYHAWSSHLADLPGGVARFDALSRAARGRRGARRPAYWAARALVPSAPLHARRRFEALVTDGAHDWYALLAHRWLMTLPRPVPPTSDTEPVEPEGVAVTVQPKLSATLTERILEVERLQAVGLGWFARRALNALRPALRGADAWAMEAQLSNLVEAYASALGHAVRRHRQILRGQPTPGDARWTMAYPRGYAATIAAESMDSGVSAALLYAFIRKESAFSVRALSPAHAMGLMQLLPPTAARLAHQRGEEGTPDLFDPTVNVRLGASYLSKLSLRFGGQIPLVAAAYNAGPQRMVPWFRGRGVEQTDIFVEQIPFRETREYVKRLVEAWVVYRVLYEGARIESIALDLPVTLDLTVRPGVDF